MVVMVGTASCGGSMSAVLGRLLRPTVCVLAVQQSGKDEGSLLPPSASFNEDVHFARKIVTSYGTYT